MYELGFVCLGAAIGIIIGGILEVRDITRWEREGRFK